MDLEIVGRHALFFDDDSMATFVNSQTALVDWNSLFIDRYDVRHLLSSLPPPRPKRRRQISDDPNLDADLDHERYLDLPTESPSPSRDETDIDDGTASTNADGSASTNADGFRAVPYSYGSSSDLNDQKTADVESGFYPPFPVPDYLLQHLMLGEEMELSKPPNEKLHQIMARTSSFVSNHGGQSEIVLRVKQGGNPTFGFLMPDHHLHPYFRFLVEHQELLTGKSSVGDKKVEGGKDSGALSLLSSVYGTVEDEDTKEESARDCKTKDSAEGDEGDSSGPERSKEAAKVATVGDVASKPSLRSNDQAHLIKRNPSVCTVNVERKQIKTEDHATEKPLTYEKLLSSTVLAQPKLEVQIVEPPIEMKRAIDKIVDFIQKNGKELEATLAAQDVKYGMFPFLRPASLYHAYYRKVLQEAEELRSCNKSDFTKKEDMKQERMDSAVKDDKPALGSELQDDSAKKEKQKMASDKPKIELQKEPFKPVEPQMRVNVDVNTAAAILEAARRGIRNPQLGILSGKPLDETSKSLGNDGRNTSSKSRDLAKSMGQLISGSAAASESDSSEAVLTKEQKLKAERLKRAKMFVAMLKPGAQAAQHAEPSRSLSVEPVASVSISNAAKEREGSSLPSEVSETKQADDGNSGERRSKRNYRSRSQRDEDDEMGEEEEEEEEEDNEERSMEEVIEDTKTEKKHSSRKLHDRHKHKTRHSRDKHKHESSSDDEYHSRSPHGNKHRKSSDRHELYDSSDTEREHRHRSSKHNKDADYSKDKRSHRHKSRKHDKHLDSSDDEHRRHHRHRSSRRKHEDSSDGEHGHRQRSSKRIKKDEKRVEEGNVSKSDHSDRKASPEDNNPQNEPTQVSDELRAKIRAMLADTL